MMMGAGLLLMLFALLLVIGVPLLIIALVAGGGLAKLFKPRDQSPRSNSSSLTPGPAAGPAYMRKCPTCGRGVKADWNVCPSCGASLT